MRTIWPATSLAQLSPVRRLEHLELQALAEVSERLQLEHLDRPQSRRYSRQGAFSGSQRPQLEDYLAPNRPSPQVEACLEILRLRHRLLERRRHLLLGRLRRLHSEALPLLLNLLYSAGDLDLGLLLCPSSSSSRSRLFLVGLPPLPDLVKAPVASARPRSRLCLDSSRLRLRHRRYLVVSRPKHQLLAPRHLSLPSLVHLRLLHSQPLP